MAPLGYFLFLCGLKQALGSYPIWWSLALGPQYSSLGTQPILCASIPGLVPKQLRFCRNYVEIMPSVAEGVKISIQECQHQFRGRRWNCTTVNNSLAIFGPVLDKATRESAFVHAIASAGVAFAVTRSCAEGSAAICGCSGRQQGSPGEGWKWGGCSEDIEFGGMVSREFADARENRPDARSAMNRHNNEAGRQAIASHMHLKCKCHGLSGSCEVKTCWWSQPDFRAIGDFLKDKYDSASEMVVEKHRESRGWVETLRPRYTHFKVPTERDLVYYEASPNFCEPNPETGSFGTRDRTCNVSSHGIDGCDLLCCGRGHNARSERRREKCHCVFHWCCYPTSWVPSASCLVCVEGSPGGTSRGDWCGGIWSLLPLGSGGQPPSAAPWNFSGARRPMAPLPRPGVGPMGRAFVLQSPTNGTGSVWGRRWSLTAGGRGAAWPEGPALPRRPCALASDIRASSQ
ncbi:protein Wnt-3a isoform X1 [Equus quagga]|uniref:protein Wnt-3a isoform X1 n=1 Tax=Equus quagga TaxID=89248 RepID=UPI001EE31660|nr:protein Wnt-3a isoform X1 [Equus quagga]